MLSHRAGINVSFRDHEVLSDHSALEICLVFAGFVGPVSGHNPLSPSRLLRPGTVGNTAVQQLIAMLCGGGVVFVQIQS